MSVLMLNQVLDYYPLNTNGQVLTVGSRINLSFGNFNLQSTKDIYEVVRQETKDKFGFNADEPTVLVDFFISKLEDYYECNILGNNVLDIVRIKKDPA